MAQATEERTIDGVRVTLTQLPAMRALKLLPRLGKILAPVLGHLNTDVAAALPLLFDRLTGEELEDITKELLSTALADGKPLLQVMDLVFQGRPETVLKVLKFALEANYRGFFSGLAGLSGGAAGQ